MAVNLRRPILIGGIGLSFSLWLLESIHHSVEQVSDWTILGVIGAGAAAWWLQQGTPKKSSASVPTLLDRQTVETAIAEAEAMIGHLEAETQHLDANSQAAMKGMCQTMAERGNRLKAELDRQEIRLAVTGGKAAGKTTLIQALKSGGVPQRQQPITFIETPALFTGTDSGTTAQKNAIELAISSDLVLFLITGDLTEPECQTLQQLKSAGVRTILLWNKQDQYLPEERASVLQQQQFRIKEILESGDVMAISASPVPVKVRQHQPDGSVKEWQEVPAPEIHCLTSRLSQILAEDAQKLVFASSLRAAGALKLEAKTTLNRLRRDRAMPAIEQYQWIAAAAAFANPVPALDLLATGAIASQLVVDLGAIYQQKFSLQQAQAIATTMASFMLKLGLVELSTKTISTVLKSNAITFVAGGAIQGVSAAYLTRIAGLSLIEYFQAQDVAVPVSDEKPLNFDKLGKTLQSVFQQNQQAVFLQSFVKQVASRLTPQTAE